MNHRFTTRATQDLIEVAEYIRRESPAAALRVRAAILKTVSLASRHPGAGRLVQLSGVRRLVVPRFRYIIYYTVDENEDEVIGIRHGARQRTADQS